MNAVRHAFAEGGDATLLMTEATPTFDATTQQTKALSALIQPSNTQTMEAASPGAK